MRLTAVEFKKKIKNRSLGLGLVGMSNIGKSFRARQLADEMGFERTSVDEAIEKANNTPYGLSGGVWTDKGSKIFKVTNRLRAGVVWANTYNKFDPTAPFGGYKESGVGREGGLHGLLPYVSLN